VSRRLSCKYISHVTQRYCYCGIYRLVDFVSCIRLSSPYAFSPFDEIACRLFWRSVIKKRFYLSILFIINVYNNFKSIVRSESWCDKSESVLYSILCILYSILNKYIYIYIFIYIFIFITHELDSSNHPACV